MLRTLIVASSLLLLAACATPRLAADTSTLAQRAAADSSDELECMADCLDDSTEDCESCADRCLTRSPGAAVASILY